VFGAKRPSVVRYLKQNNKRKIAAGLEVFNKVFAVIDADKNVNSLRNFLLGEGPSGRAGIVLADGLQDLRAALRGQ
jgi:hypothetical protein